MYTYSFIQYHPLLNLNGSDAHRRAVESIRAAMGFRFIKPQYMPP
jgi:hypothetical protein